jgi:uncharacterized protein (TIGR02271 family)
VIQARAVALCGLPCGNHLNQELDMNERTKGSSVTTDKDKSSTATGAVAGGVAGGVAGAAITGALAGGVTGPVGAAIGAAAGAVVGALAGRAKSDDPARPDTATDRLDDADRTRDAGTGAVAGGATGGIAGGALAGSLAGGVTGPVGAAVGAAAGATVGALAGRSGHADSDTPESTRDRAIDDGVGRPVLSADSRARRSVTDDDTGLREVDSTDDRTVIPVVQEDLEVGKRTVEAGAVRVESRLVEEPVRESVSLREERATIDRHPVDRPATQADLDAALGERRIEVHETVERPVVQKTARVVEEVAVGKDVRQKQAEIQDSVRHTEVDVQRMGGDALSSDLEQDYREHWNSRFASSGRRYDDMAPAYRFGHSLASDGRYRDRSWDEFEPEVRTEWGRTHEGSAWDDMKDAVRHAWQRARS